MEVNLQNFIDINIQRHYTINETGIRDTVVIFTATGNSEQPVEIKSLAEAYAKYEDGTTIRQYLDVYFNNGGIKAIIYEGNGLTNLNKDTFRVKIKALPDEYICIVFDNVDYALVKYVAEDFLLDKSDDDKASYGIKEKLFFARITDVNNTDNIKNFIVKYSNVVGAEMTIPAYLNKIRIYASNSVYDYAFTQENLQVENINDAAFKDILTNNMNVNIDLANVSRVCGGNCKNGDEITNNFVRIVLCQTLTNKLINVLVSKIKNNSGLAKLYTAITQELSYYLTNGYLTTDKIWTDETVTVTENGQTYTIIEKGTALLNGFIVKILPMQSLSIDDKSMHKAPKIYLIIADQYAIRKVTLNGEVI